MKDFAQKLRRVEQQIAKEKGSFLLFALFLREDAPDLWDVLVSAPWIEANKGEALRYITPRVQAVATPEEWSKLSRIAIIEKGQKALGALHVDVEHGLFEIQNINFFGMPIKHAYIITAKKVVAAHSHEMKH